MIAFQIDYNRVGGGRRWGFMDLKKTLLTIYDPQSNVYTKEFCSFEAPLCFFTFIPETLVHTVITIKL